MRWTATLLAVLMLLTATPSAALAGDPPFPSVIDLPDGFQPEGIAIGTGTTFYAGSLAGAGIYRGDLRTGDIEPFIPGNQRMFVGMKVDDRGRLWVAGGASGSGYVFDASSGEQLATFPFGGTPTFINDVIVTQDAAWFTESQRPVIYRVDLAPNGTIGAVTMIDLTGQIDVAAGFNLNGITATPNGSTLIVVNTATGKLYTIDSDTHAVDEIDLGGVTLTAGDGILLHGKTLYVVRNRLNQIAVVALSPDFTSGTVVETLTSPFFQVPTTIARHGNALYAVNARFGTPPTPSTTYTAVRVER